MVLIDFVENREVQLGEYEQFISLDSDTTIILGYEDDFILQHITPRIFREIDNSFFEGKAKIMMRSILYQKYKKEIADEWSTETASSFIEYFSSILKDRGFLSHIC